MTADEFSLANDILKAMAATSQKTFDLRRHAFRDAFAKSHGFLKGELTVSADLPEHLRQGVFARAATYPAVIRLSSASGDVVSDTIPDARGMAIKLIGVEGARLLPNDTSKNQDFLLVNVPVFSPGTLARYKQSIGASKVIGGSPEFVQRLVAASARGVEKAIEEEGRCRTLSSAANGLARDNANLLGETYHSMAALRFGEYIAKISTAPLSANVKALTGKKMRRDRRLRPCAISSSIIFGVKVLNINCAHSSASIWTVCRSRMRPFSGPRIAIAATGRSPHYAFRRKRRIRRHVVSLAMTFFHLLLGTVLKSIVRLAQSCA